MIVSIKFMLGIILIIGMISPALQAAERVEYKPRQYEFPVKYTVINGIKICYADEGSGGPVIVFVHGLSGSMDNWTHSIRYFSATHRVVALDLPGHGNSERRNDIPYGIPLFADTIKGLLDQLGIEKAVLVGNSMGGHTVCYFEWKYPDRCVGAVLSDSAGIKTNFPWFSHYFIKHHPKWLVKKMTNLTRKSARKGKPGLMGDFSKGGKQGKWMPMFWDATKPTTKQWAADNNAYMEQFVRTDELPKWNYALVRSALSLMETPMTDKLGQIHVPTLVVWGDNDGLVPIECAYIFANKIPGSFLAIIRDCGHVPAVEEPKAFNEAIEKFILTLVKKENAAPAPESNSTSQP